jgi:hypothetical protein
MVGQGTYRDGAIILDKKADVPEGQRVKVEFFPVASNGEQATVWQKLLEVSGALDEGPSDASRNHDHYIYGSPKRKPES